MPRIGSFGLSIRIKYKLEFNHVIWVAVNKHVFGETRFTYLRITSPCSQCIVAENSKLSRTKDKESSYFSTHYFLFRFIYRAKNKRLTKSGRELVPAENRAPYCTRTNAFVNKFSNLSALVLLRRSWVRAGTLLGSRSRLKIRWHLWTCSFLLLRGRLDSPDW